jgi:hypothetical protein
VTTDRVDHVEASPADDPPRSARVLVGVLLVLLVGAGIGVEAWPLTGWRLFSAARDDTQTQYVLEAVGADGSTRLVDLDELPGRPYSNAEWAMAELPDAPDTRSEAVCQALLEPVVEVEPGLAELRIARNDARLMENDGAWTVVDDLETVHVCRPSYGGGPEQAP